MSGSAPSWISQSAASHAPSRVLPRRVRPHLMSYLLGFFDFCSAALSRLADDHMQRGQNAGKHARVYRGAASKCQYTTHAGVHDLGPTLCVAAAAGASRCADPIDCKTQDVNVTDRIARPWKCRSRNQFPVKGFTAKRVTIVEIFASLANCYYNTTHLLTLKHIQKQLFEILINCINKSHLYKTMPY